MGDIPGSNGIGLAADIPVIGGDLQFWVGKGFFKHLAQETSFSVSDFSTRCLISVAMWTTFGITAPFSSAMLSAATRR
jgi:hypothetical protein